MRIAGQATPPPPPLLHATRPPAKAKAKATKDNNRLNIARHARLRLGITNRDKLASTAPLPAYHEPRLGTSLNEVQAFEELAVVAMVKVPVAAALPEIARGLVELKLKVGDAVTPLGLVVRAAVRVTLPVGPPVGVTVIVEVLPVVAPAAMLTGVPLAVKLGDSW
jgi:hypothetical protein